MTSRRTGSQKSCVNCGYPAVNRPWCPLCHSINGWYPVELLVSAGLIIFTVGFGAMLFQFAWHALPAAPPPTPTNTPSPTPTLIPTPTATSTPTPTPSFTPTPVLTNTPIPTTLPTPTLTVSLNPSTTGTDGGSIFNIVWGLIKIFGLIFFISFIITLIIVLADR